MALDFEVRPVRTFLSTSFWTRKLARKLFDIENCVSGIKRVNYLIIMFYDYTAFLSTR